MDVQQALPAEDHAESAMRHAGEKRTHDVSEANADDVGNVYESVCEVSSDASVITQRPKTEPHHHRADEEAASESDGCLLVDAHHEIRQQNDAITADTVTDDTSNVMPHATGVETAEEAEAEIVEVSSITSPDASRNGALLAEDAAVVQSNEDRDGGPSRATGTYVTDDNTHIAPVKGDTAETELFPMEQQSTGTNADDGNEIEKTEVEGCVEMVDRETFVPSVAKVASTADAATGNTAAEDVFAVASMKTEAPPSHGGEQQSASSVTPLASQGMNTAKENSKEAPAAGGMVKEAHHVLTHVSRNNADTVLSDTSEAGTPSPPQLQLDAVAVEKTAEAKPKSRTPSIINNDSAASNAASHQRHM
jgi:hypothetical protein